MAGRLLTLLAAVLALAGCVDYAAEGRRAGMGTPPPRGTSGAQNERVSAAIVAMGARDHRETLRLTTLVIESNEAFGIGLATAYDLRANARLRMGDRSGARADAESAATAAPEIVNGHFTLGWISLGDENWAEAERHFSRVAAIEPQHWVATFFRGVARLLQHDPEGAFADFDRVTILRPGYDEAWAWRGLVHELRGERADALADYRRTLLLNNENNMALRGVRRLLGGARRTPPPPAQEEFRRRPRDAIVEF
jgi:tetratricopeptide (TPR) repeat protein